jgi:hypothetical protein
MSKHKSRVDYQRVLTLVEEEPKFAKMEENKDAHPDVSTGESLAMAMPPMKPKEAKQIEIVKPVDRKLEDSKPDELETLKLLRDKKLVTQREFIRYRDIVPRSDVYEALEGDFKFVESLHERFAVGNTQSRAKAGLLNVKMLELLITEFEVINEVWHSQQEREKVPLIDRKLITWEMSEKQIMETDTFAQLKIDMVREVFNYWLTQRNELRRPLVRKFWKNRIVDDMNHKVAFRVRNKDRIKTRRKDVSYHKMINLRGEMELGPNLVDGVRIRERLKAMLVDLKYCRFLERIEHVTAESLEKYKEILDKKTKTSSSYRKLMQRYQRYVTKKEEKNQELGGSSMKMSSMQRSISRIRERQPQPTLEDSAFSIDAIIASTITEAMERGLKPEYFKELSMKLRAVKPAPPKPNQVPEPMTQHEILAPKLESDRKRHERKRVIDGVG